jgi:hypothetical protein
MMQFGGAPTPDGGHARCNRDLVSVNPSCAAFLHEGMIARQYGVGAGWRRGSASRRMPRGRAPSYCRQALQWRGMPALDRRAAAGKCSAAGRRLAT